METHGAERWKSRSLLIARNILVLTVSKNVKVEAKKHAKEFVLLSTDFLSHNENFSIIVIQVTNEWWSDDNENHDVHDNNDDGHLMIRIMLLMVDDDYGNRECLMIVIVVRILIFMMLMMVPMVQ